MASMSISRSVLSSSGSLPSNLSRKNQLLLPCLGYSPVRTQSIKRSFTLRCTAEDSEKVTPPVSAGPKIPAPPTPTPTPTPVAPSKPKVSTKFTDLLAFSGPAPERINGRLAMVGFVAALAVELSKGEGLVSQISDGGASWFVATSVLLTAASLIPLLKGSRAEAVTKGFMNGNAELWNGRFAMLGLVALAFTEYVKGTTLV